MNIYDLYGFRKDNISELVETIQELLDIKFEAHESSYKGNYYSCKLEYEIFYNQIAKDDWLEMDFKDYNLMLYVSYHSDPDNILSQLLNADIGASVLRRTKVIPRKLFKTFKYQNGKFVENIS